MPINRNQVTASAASQTNNCICLSQSLVAAGLLTINGSLSQPGPVPFNGTAAGPNIAVLTPPQNVVIHSAGNDSGLTWTITGFDYGGSPLSETLAGGNAVPVTSKYLYAQVWSIKGSAATASTVTVGDDSGQTFSPWLIMGAQRNHYQWTARSFIPTGDTATYDIQVTSDIQIMNEVGGFADDIVTVLSAQTGNTSSFNDSPWMAMRLRVTAGGPVVLRALESRTA